MFNIEKKKKKKKTISNDSKILAPEAATGGVLIKKGD